MSNESKRNEYRMFVRDKYGNILEMNEVYAIAREELAKMDSYEDKVRAVVMSSPCNETWSKSNAKTIQKYLPVKKGIFEIQSAKEIFSFEKTTGPFLSASG